MSFFQDISLGDTIRTLRRLLPYLKKWKSNAIWAAIIVVVTSLLQIPRPFLMKYAIDNVFPEKDTNLLALIVVLVFGLSTIIGIGSFLGNYLLSTFRQLVTQHLQIILYDHIQRLPLSFHNSKGPGYTSARIQSDPNSVSSLFSEVLFRILVDFASSSFGLIAMITISPDLTLLTLIILPFYAYAILKFANRLRSATGNLQEASARLGQALVEKIANLLLIKAFCAEEFERNRIEKKFNDVTVTKLKHSRIQLLSSIIPSFVGSLGPLMILWWGGLKVIEEVITLGDFIAFSSLLALVYRPVNSIGSINPSVQKAIVGLKRVFELMDEPEENYKSSYISESLNTPGVIEITNLKFAYPNDPQRLIINDLSLQIEPQEKIAIVGRSGVGKSTVVNLIMGLYRPNLGSIMIGGKDIYSMGCLELRKKIALVPQSPFIFAGTIRDNVQYGIENLSEEKMIQACMAAGLESFIQDLPFGYDTLVGEQGVNLSGGQRQRIAIARALFRDSGILIFDEATSELDLVTEKIIQSFLQDKDINKTIIVISHRLSTVLESERVVVLDSGGIVAQGNHNELNGRCSLYRELFYGDSRLPSQFEPVIESNF